jgi:peroxin-5
MMNDDSCGGVNPMAQMLKQFGQDRSLQRVSQIVKSKFLY